MNLKRLLLVPGTLAFALSLGLPMLPISAQTPAPAESGQKPGGKLQLDSAQKEQMKQIRTATRAQIEAVLDQELTADQKARLKQARENRQKPDWAAIGISQEKAQQIQQRIKAIRQDSKAKMKQVLTPAQQQQLEQRRANWQQRRGQTGGKMRLNRPQPGSTQPQ